MSDVFNDPVGDRLRDHDLRMRRVRWEQATTIVVALVIGATVVGACWALAFVLVHNKPHFSTGVDSTGKPYCETFDERQCPIFQPGFTTTLPAEVRR